MMPSPEDFHRDIRAAKRFGLVQGLLLLPSMFSLILAIAFAVGGDWREAAVTARICRIEGAFSWRVALLHQPEFSAFACKAQRDRANRAANRAHPEKQEGPRWEIASRARVNLVVCDAMNDALSRYIGTHAQHLLSCNESIINMAVVGDRLLMPSVRGADVDDPSLKRYARSADLIWSLLCQNSTETRNES